MLSIVLRQHAEQLRRKGKTFSEIKSLLKINIPKSTLSYWCRNVPVPKSYHAKVQRLNKLNFAKAQQISSKNRREQRESFIKDIDSKNEGLLKFFAENEYSRMLSLAVLYLAEGSKTRSSVMFGNSDPAVIVMFVNLMRECYKLDERKFRCTLQCRADQDIKRLEKFWSKTTKISLKQFYKARVDKRTLGQISKKQDYKGVCRIDYFSSVVDLELRRVAQQMLESFS
jgi:NMD protein affecting ribosome stability and mRNA decay